MVLKINKKYIYKKLTKLLEKNILDRSQSQGMSKSDIPSFWERLLKINHKLNINNTATELVWRQSPNNMIYYDVEIQFYIYIGQSIQKHILKPHLISTDSIYQNLSSFLFFFF